MDILAGFAMFYWRSRYLAWITFFRGGESYLIMSGLQLYPHDEGQSWKRVLTFAEKLRRFVQFLTDFRNQPFSIINF